MAIDALLQEDAEWIRSMMEKGQKTVLAIARRLRKVQERQDWSTRELAEWCEEEQLGFDTHARVVQVLGYGRTTAVLQKAEVVTTVTAPSERLVRPITQALNQGMPEEEVAQIWERLTEGEELPSPEEVVRAVSKSKWSKKKQARQSELDEKHDARVVADIRRRQKEPTEEELAEEIINERQSVLHALVEAIAYANNPVIWDSRGLSKSVLKQWQTAAAGLNVIIKKMERNVQ